MIQRVLCWFGRHRYKPTAEARQWIKAFGKRRMHLRFEYRHQCAFCNHQTKWMRLSKYDDWEEKQRFYIEEY